MSYKQGIFDAIEALKDRTGSSSIAIKKHMQANLPKDKKWMNGMYLKALNKAVADGELTKNEGSYKLSTNNKDKAAKALKPKKAAPKQKSAPKKKTAPKKSATKKNKKAKNEKRILLEDEVDNNAHHNPLLRGTIKSVDAPFTDLNSKLAPCVIGLATATAVGLYIYKKKRSTK